MIGAIMMSVPVPLPSTAHAVSASSIHPIIDCSRSSSLCTEVQESDEIFGHYVGHDEPATLFYSNQPGSGNRMRYELTLPKDPLGQATPGKTFNFQLRPAFWFGMATIPPRSNSVVH
jgi:hypothetical protein